MLRILGRRAAACDGLTRRELLTAGGISLFGGLSLPNLLRAKQSNEQHDGPARSVVLLNLFGGPPHLDMFDLKPEAPDNVRGEFKPISTSVPGLQISELLPKTAQLMDRATLIRSYSHKYNSHNPYNVLTGFDGGNDSENYFAKVTDHPGMGSICQHLDIGSRDVPRYVMMPAFPGYTQSLRRAGPYGGYLGSQYDPLFTVCDPKVAREPKGDYDAVEPIGHPTLPSLDALPDITADRFASRGSLLGQLDQNLSQLEASGAISRLNEFKQQAFNLLSSSKTRAAFDIARESDATRDEYGRNLWGSSLLIARRLVEAGSTFITVHWESKGKNHWDLHENNFGMLRAQCPQLDQLIAAFVRDLEQRGLLDSTLFVVMGEMGRTPTINKKAGRDHWPQCGFSLLFGGGTHRGTVVGKTDKHAAYPTDRLVSAGDMVATIYQLLGVDPHMTVNDLSGRPVHIAHGGAPVFEAIA
ncbi:MAG: DUF1501 domain-containing protein [Planctomycetes bacterium]|nr:DUF1501 domain-containing protein [Planctomycetota bacterium]